MLKAQGAKFTGLAALGLALAVPAFADHGLKGADAPHVQRNGHGTCISTVTMSQPVSGLTVTRAAPRGEACVEPAAVETEIEVETEIDVNVTVIAPRTIRRGTSRCALGAPCDEYRFRDSSGAYNLGAPQPRSR